MQEKSGGVRGHAILTFRLAVVSLAPGAFGDLEKAHRESKFFPQYKKLRPCGSLKMFRWFR